MENMAVILCLAQQRLTSWLAHRHYRAIKSAAVIDLAILIVYYITTWCASGAVCGFLISKPQYCSMDGYKALLQSFIAAEQRVKPENSLLPLCSFASNIQIDLNKFIRKRVSFLKVILHELSFKLYWLCHWDIAVYPILSWLKFYPHKMSI